MKAVILLLTIMLFSVGNGTSYADSPLRVGYLVQAKEDLSAIADRTGTFSEEGLAVKRIGYRDAGKGIQALQSGTIDIGIFPARESLRAIASGKRLHIIAGGQAPREVSPLNELAEVIADADAGTSFVTVIRYQRNGLAKPLLVRFTAALISAYRNHRLAAVGQEHSSQQSYDPNPGYWRLERIWRSSGLQKRSMKRDYLSRHVYEEIYCDALDSLLDRSEDPIYKELAATAVCVPDCCPKDKKKS